MTKTTKYIRENVYVNGESLANVLQELQVIHQEIPEEHRGNAYFEIEYGEDYMESFVTWSRPETDEEYERRQTSLRESLARQEKRDREMYERLKKQFEAKVEDHL